MMRPVFLFSHRIDYLYPKWVIPHPTQESPPQAKCDPKATILSVHTRRTFLFAPWQGTQGTVLTSKLKEIQGYPHPNPWNKTQPDLETTGDNRKWTEIFWEVSIFSFWYYSTPRIWSSFFACPYPCISPPPYTPACSHIHAINESKNAKELQKSCRKTQKTCVE